MAPGALSSLPLLCGYIVYRGAFRGIFAVRWSMQIFRAVLGIAGALWYKSYQNNVREAAARELNLVRQTVLSGNKQLAVTDLNKYVSKYGKTADTDRSVVQRVAEVAQKRGVPRVHVVPMRHASPEAPSIRRACPLAMTAP